MSYKHPINTIIFDLGGVLVDWDPKYVYRKIFNGDEEKVDWFLTTICTPEWNLEQDSGRTIKEGNAIKIKEFPEYEDFIKLFYEEWPNMFKDVIDENLKIFKNLLVSGNYKVYALTNWSAEKWSKALELFPFFNDFHGVVVSGQEKVRKPDVKIYKTLFKKFNVDPKKAIFIDDNLENIKAAKSLNLNTIHYYQNLNLEFELKLFGIKT